MSWKIVRHRIVGIETPFEISDDEEVVVVEIDGLHDVARVTTLSPCDPPPPTPADDELPTFAFGCAKTIPNQEYVNA